MQDLPDTLDCSISQETDAITPEEREELKVSGPDCILLSLHSVFKNLRLLFMRDIISLTLHTKAKRSVFVSVW